jgi:hypothetical protein
MHLTANIESKIEGLKHSNFPSECRIVDEHISMSLKRPVSWDIIYFMNDHRFRGYGVLD